MSGGQTAGSRSERRRATENALLDALEVVLVRDGIRNLTLNAVVDQAGVSKPLLYRYFSDLSGLLSAWAERRAFEPRGVGARDARKEQPIDRQAFMEQVATDLTAGGDFLRQHPVMLECMAEELTAESELSAAFADARRRQSAPFVRAMLSDPRYLEPAVRSRIVVLNAAVTYLAMRAQRAPNFMGLRLDTDTGWQEAMSMVRAMALSDSH